MFRLCICLLVLPVILLAFTGHDELINAFAHEAWQPISRQCCDRTEYDWGGKKAIYTQAEVGQLLQNFFSHHHADKCILLQSNRSPRGAEVMTLKYFSGNNIYKISVYIQAPNGKRGDIQTIRIEAIN